MNASAFARAFWPLSGFFLWAAQFTVIYAVKSVSCARGWWETSFAGVGVVHLAIGAVTLVALLAAGMVFRRAWTDEAADAQPSDSFLERLTLWGSGLGIVAIVWNALPALILPACA